MTFAYQGQTWQAVTDCPNGVIAVLGVEGKRTRRQGYFPYPLPHRCPVPQENPDATGIKAVPG